MYGLHMVYAAVIIKIYLSSSDREAINIIVVSKQRDCTMGGHYVAAAIVLYP